VTIEPTEEFGQLLAAPAGFVDAELVSVAVDNGIAATDPVLIGDHGLLVRPARRPTR
jgi:hypothetical protein